MRLLVQVTVWFPLCAQCQTIRPSTLTAPLDKAFCGRAVPLFSNDHHLLYKCTSHAETLGRLRERRCMSIRRMRNTHTRYWVANLDSSRQRLDQQVRARVR